MSEPSYQAGFTVYGDPKAQPRTRAFMRKGGKHAGVYDPGTADGWKRAVAEAAYHVRPATPLTGPVKVDITFVFRRPKKHFFSGKRATVLRSEYAGEWHDQKPDRDNLEKAVLDAISSMQQILQCPETFWRDDCQVCTGMVSKEWAHDSFVGARISVRTLDGTTGEQA